MFDQLLLTYDSDDSPPLRRGARRQERMREVTTRITHSHSVNQRRRREQEAERTLARARRARMEAQKFQEIVEHLREAGVLPPRG